MAMGLGTNLDTFFNSCYNCNWCLNIWLYEEINMAIKTIEEAYKKLKEMHKMHTVVSIKTTDDYINMAHWMAVGVLQSIEVIHELMQNTREKNKI
jgi:hypothetical protein